MYCRNCGKQLPDGSRFCVACGTSQDIPAGPPPQAPPGQPYGATPQAPPVMGIPVSRASVSPKSRLAATLLAYFVGTLGVHRFYIGKAGTGGAILALTIVGATLLGVGVAYGLISTAGAMYGRDVSEFAGAMAVLIAGYIMVGAASLWAFVDFIIIVIGGMKDKQGRPISKWNN